MPGYLIEHSVYLQHCKSEGSVAFLARFFEVPPSRFFDVVPVGAGSSTVVQTSYETTTRFSPGGATGLTIPLETAFEFERI